MELENFKVNSKILLFGEYIYFFGYKAVGLSTDVFSTHICTTSQKNANYNYINNIVDLNNYKIHQLIVELLRPMNKFIQINSSIPHGGGYGSSASFCLGISKLIKKDSENQISYARELENLFHGKSSGLDVNLVSKPNGLYAIEKDSFQSLDIPENIDIVIMLTPRLKRTDLIIKSVLDSYYNDKTKKNTLDKIGEISNKFLNNISNINSYNMLYDMNGLLFSIGLENENIKKVIDYIKTMPGSLGAKMSGAGCGGSFFALVEKDKFEIEKLNHFVKSNGLDIDFVKSFNLKRNII